MFVFFVWFIWSLVSSIGIKYTSMQLLNIDIKLTSAFYIFLTYQWIRFIKPVSSKDLNKTNAKKNTKSNSHPSLSEFNNIINSNFKKKNKDEK